MPIYTKQGDDGTTGLVGGIRLSKADARFTALGTVDELNATLGLARSLATDGDGRRMGFWLERLQPRCFELGSELASPGGEHRFVTETDVTELEAQIDAWQTTLPKLTHFILPGGSPLGAELHRTRAVARRAERAVVRLAAATDVRPVVLKWLNRLSDALFVAARIANHEAGVTETVWEGSSTTTRQGQRLTR
jgi:cob(I)alamin adenosyltransferase